MSSSDHHQGSQVKQRDPGFGLNDVFKAQKGMKLVHEKGQNEQLLLKKKNKNISKRG